MLRIVVCNAHCEMVLLNTGCARAGFDSWGLELLRQSWSPLLHAAQDGYVTVARYGRRHAQRTDRYADDEVTGLCCPHLGVGAVLCTCCLEAWDQHGHNLCCVIPLLRK